MKYRNRVLSLLIALFMLVSSLVSSVNVYADASDRITTFLNIGAGKQTTDVDMDSLSLSEQDLRFLGVYISNFFVPFGTELGESDSDDVTATNKEDIKKALQTNIHFSDSLSESITETLLGLSRASIEKLELYVSEEYQKGYVAVSDSTASMPLNSYTAVSCMFGGLSKLASYYPNKNSAIEGIIDGTYKYGYFAYTGEDGVVPVFDFVIDFKEITASQASFIKCIESANIKKGFGLSFFDFTEKEMGASEENYEKVYNEIDEAEAYKMSTYGTELYIDCFGNLIYMGGNHQYIAVPGCMNPYSWVVVDENGEDVGLGIGGTSYNVINIPSMALYDNEVVEDTDNTLFSSIEGGKGVLETKILSSKLSEVYDKESKKTATGQVTQDTGNTIHYNETTVTNGLTMRRVRGSSENDFSSGFLDNLGKSSPYRALAKKAETGFKKANSKAMNYYNSFDTGITDSDGGNIDTSVILVPTKNFKPDKDFSLGVNSKVNYIDSFVYLDTLGAYHFDNSSEAISEYSTFNVISYTDSSNEMGDLRKSLASWGNSGDNGFTNTYKDIESGKMVIPASVSAEGMVGIYITYAFSSLYDEYSEVSKKDTIGKLGYRMNIDLLPSIPDEPLTLSDTAKADMMLSSIRDWVYYLLHPTDGLEYFKVWITNKLNSFLLGLHDDMVGTNGSGSINGTTKYRGFSGYVTTPELSDIPWTSSMLDMYNNAIPFLLVIMILIMLGTYVVGVLSFQKAFIGLIIFAVSIALPPIVINGAVGTANRFSSSLYGEKFTYWALVQHESYSSAIDDAASGDSYENYLKTLYEKNSEATGNQGDESVMIKWQAPKKMASLMLTNEDEKVFNGLSNSFLSGMLNSTYSGESYTDNKDSVYLYRSYIDIANFSRYIHRGLEEGLKQPINQNITNDMMKDWSDSLQNTIRDFGTSYEADRSAGYANENNTNGGSSVSGLNNSIIRVRLPLASKLVNEQLSNLGTVRDMSLDDYVGINQDAFQFSIPMFNVGDDELVFKTELKTDNFDTKKYANTDFSSLAAYGLMSENPFYYFSWCLYEMGLSEETSSNTGYRSLLLSEDNAGFFYNTKGNGEMKDFMDMKSLFTYIIPYLNECNQLVYEWDEVYGIYIHEGVPTEEGHQEEFEVVSGMSDREKANMLELQQKYWHNLNVARLYNMYTPWVDIMYECSYAEPEKISYLGEEYIIEDPINPSCYPDERPMVFSRSEMLDYGLKENNLTKVEKLILECQEGMQERLFKLLNYHTFNDVVLNTAAAMNCAFEFNTTFSENSLVGANHNIYPQSFELNDFSYDAFLRFILANSTGESMIVGEGEDFYSNITESSSMTTVIVMLVLDVLAMYVIPGFKMFFIVGIFLMAILLILVTAFRVDQQQKFITKFIGSFIKPVLKFLGVTCGMSLVVSWFMGEGNTSITGSMETSIALGDPVMAMLVMIVLNCFVVYFYFKILYDMFKDLKKEGKLVASFVGGVVGSLGGAISSNIFKSSSRKSTSQSSFTSSSENSVSLNGEASPRAKSRGSAQKVFEKEKGRDSEIRSDIGDNKNNILNKDIKKEKSFFKSSSNIESKTQEGLNKIRSGSSKGEDTKEV